MLKRCFRQTEAPTVTIVLRTRGRAEFLPRAIESVLGQVRQDWFLLVLDDNNSAEETKSILARYFDALRGRCELISAKRPEGKGLGYLLNFGLSRSKSEFIAIHDDDDSWSPNFLARSLAEIKDHMGIVSQANLV